MLKHIANSYDNLFNLMKNIILVYFHEHKNNKLIVFHLFPKEENLGCYIDQATNDLLMGQSFRPKPSHKGIGVYTPTSAKKGGHNSGGRRVEEWRR